MILNSDNYLQYAMSHYNNCQLNSISEFTEDLHKISCIQRIFTRYHTSGKLNARLLINHLVILVNVFGKGAIDLLYYMINTDDMPQLNALLFVMSYIEDPSTVELDEEIVLILRKEIN